MARTVLVVDDHPSFPATARSLLQAEGFEVVGEAVDGADALAKARELRPEVVLLDVQRPDIRRLRGRLAAVPERRFAVGRARLEP
jgi:DNA-binding NarL/FixJ family response regulator